MEPVWKFQHFNELTLTELYEILKARDEVFVVEQQCNYADCDGKDKDCYHLSAWINGELAAYARILQPGMAYPEASIGRVLTTKNYRRTGLGKDLMKRAIELTLKEFKTNSIHISAQLYLKNFYNLLGFVEIGETYLEDNIPHISMILYS